MRDRARETVGLRNREGFIRHFERRLNLSDAQRDSLKDELDGTYRQMAELREETSRRYNALIDTLAIRIMPALTKEQQELFREQESKFRRFLPKEKRGGPGRDRPEYGDWSAAGEDSPGADKPPPYRANGRNAPAPLQQKTDEMPARDRPLQRDRGAPSMLDSAVNADDPAAMPMLPPLLGRGMQKAAQRLKLTQEQSASIAAIVAKGRARIKEMRVAQEGGAETKDARRRQVAEVMRAMDAEIVNLLTSAQREEWMRMQKEMVEHIQKSRRQRDTAAEAGGR